MRLRADAGDISGAIKDADTRLIDPADTRYLQRATFRMRAGDLRGASRAIMQAAQAGNPGMMNLMMIVFLFAGMWFLIIAPQRKKQKEQQKMIDALGSGDKVVTVGGFFGIVQSVKDDRVVLKIAEGTKVEVRKSAVEACLNKDNDKK